MAHLILASGSPRRKELLLQVGLDFSIHSPDIDESVLEHEQIEQYVQRLAESKAKVVLALHPQSTVIAADTSLVFANQIIGKPTSKQHAFEIWTLLSGQKHEVLTGVCVANAHQLLSVVVRTEVEFQQFSLNDMEEYWATGEHLGKGNSARTAKAASMAAIKAGLNAQAGSGRSATGKSILAQFSANLLAMISMAGLWSNGNAL